MDTTPIDDLLTQLESADPADAPDVADEVTASLAAALDGPEPQTASDNQPETEAP